MWNKLLRKPKRGLLFVLSAPGGTGKTTLTKMLQKAFPQLHKGVSFTTRPPRAGEQAKKDYYFIGEEAFQKKRKKGQFLEYTKFSDHYYGTEKKAVFTALNRGKHVILVLDVVGAKKIRKQMDAVLIFISPPSLAELKKRLLGRKTETKKSLQERLLRAKEEIKWAKDYDYHVVNQNLQEAFEKLKAIVVAEECRVTQQMRKKYAP